MKLKFALCSAFVVLCLAGCKSQTTPAVAPAALEDTSIPNLTIIYGSEPVARSLGFVKGKVFRDGQLMKLTGSVKNLSQATFPIGYQVAWTDGDGAPLMNSPSWIRVTLNPRAEKPIVNVAKETRGAQAIVTFKVPADVQIFIPEPDPVEVMKYQQEMAARQSQK